MLIRLKEYELYCKENEIESNTLKNYKNTLTQLLNYCEKNRITTLEKEILITYKNHLKTAEYRPGKYYKLETCNQKITAMNIYFNWSGEKHLMLKPFKIQTKSHKESIDKNDFERLLKYSKYEDLKLFMLVIANTGLRITEVCTLKKMDLNKSIIEVSNKGKIRYIDIPLFLKKQLRDYMRDKQEDDFIFSKGQSSYRDRLKVVAGNAKVKKSKVYPHSFRHYFAKMYIAEGGDSTELQQMLGHADIATTTIYTHLNKEELAKKFRANKNR